jgi:hypothetical protein
MIRDPTIGCRLFVYGIVHPAVLDDAGGQYVLHLDGHTRLYGVWLPPQEADALLLVPSRQSGA